jgi:hypothetical protein
VYNTPNPQPKSSAETPDAADTTTDADNNTARPNFLKVKKLIPRLPFD